MSLGKAGLYAGVAAIIAALVQVAQIAQALAISGIIDSPGRWAISAIAGVVSAAVLAALPWLKAVLPEPPTTGSTV